MWVEQWTRHIAFVVGKLITFTRNPAGEREGGREMHMHTGDGWAEVFYIK
jgi:hypothetical protein